MIAVVALFQFWLEVGTWLAGIYGVHFECLGGNKKRKERKKERKKKRRDGDVSGEKVVSNSYYLFVSFRL
jgi:hypothetical protein